MKPAVVKGAITYVAREINAIPKNDTMEGTKVANYTYGKILDEMSKSVEKREKKEKRIEDAGKGIVKGIQEDMYR